MKNLFGARAGRWTTWLSLVGLLVATGCSADGASTGDAAADGLPEVVKVVSINPTTGPAAFAGVEANKGYALAVKQINEQGFLGETRVELSYEDTRGEPQTAAQHVTRVINDDSVSAVFGSVSSNDAVAMSPLVHSKGVPTIYTQAGSDGVVVGDWTYRATPLMREYYPLLKSFITEQGGKTMGIIYTEATPTLQDIGANTLPAMAEELGIEVTASVTTQATTQDYSAPISQVLKTKPDLMAVIVLGAANVTAMNQLRQAGWDGPVLGNAGAGSGNLAAAGKDGHGMVWANDFSPEGSAASTAAFVEAFRAEHGEDPTNYAAEAFDAAWFLARSIKLADSADRTAIKDAMAQVAAEPFDGALGEQLSWQDGDLVVPGVVIQWGPDGEELLYEGE